MTNIDEYAKWAIETWENLPDRDADHAVFGLAEEVGEVMGVFKREARGEGFNKEKFIKEMGDVGYYWVRLCVVHGVSPSEVLATNKAKLLDRKARGVITGSGDNR